MLVNRLPQIMTQKGVSIRQLSKMTGVTYTTVRAMVQGQRRSIQLDVLDAVCEVLQIQPGDIYNREPPGREEAGRQQPGVVQRKFEGEVSPAASTEPQGAAGQVPGPLGKTDPQKEWRAW